MTATGDQSEEGTDMGEGTASTETGGINRRRLLQGAVAAGVGAVAWTSPSISSMGGTPAYAAVCTGGYQNFVIDYRNTSCNCGKNPNKYVSYKPPGTTQQCTVDNVLPREVTFHVRQNNGTYVALTTSGACPPDAAGDPGAYARIRSNNSSIDFEFCRLRIDAMDGNCENLVVRPNGTVYGPIVPKNADIYTAMPKVGCGSGADGSNVFLRVSLECANDDACFPPTPAAP
jgi:hypothetical protein